MSRISPAGAGRSAHAAALLAALLTLLAVPALARAESLTLSIDDDPVAGLTSGVDYQYDTAGLPLSLVVIDRPADGPPCQPTSTEDASLTGNGNFTYIMPGAPLTGTGGDHIPYTFATPGSHRVCAWLSRTPDDVAATAAATADVRAPHASLAITATAPITGAGTAGSDLRVEATGSVEAPTDVLVTAVPGTQRCPATYDEDSAPRAFDVAPVGVPTRVTGTFDLVFLSHTRLAFGRWTACAYLQDGTVADSATASATAAVLLMLKPSARRAPRIRRRRHALSCDGGSWRGNPKPKLTFAWLSGPRQLPFHGRNLPITHATNGRLVRCRVTATNAAGTKTATSRAVRAR